MVDLEELRKKTRKFVEDYVKPYANEIDEKGDIPLVVLDKLKEEGYLGINVSKEFGGGGLGYRSIGVINEEFGRGCSSVRSILTVHGMVTMAVEKWASKILKENILKDLGTGKKIGAFCLTEPEVGSDANSIATHVIEEEDYYIINGTKKWITMGQIADVFLVFGKIENLSVAILVEKDKVEGLHIKPLNNINGMRGSKLAEITFTDCRVDKKYLLGGKGLGLSHISLSSLLYGRFTIACGCLGIADECLDLSIQYAKKRKQFGERLYKHQLIKKLIAEIVTELHAARALCNNAGQLIDSNSQDASAEAFIAKYYCSKMVTNAVNNAIQIHGANGLIKDLGLERFYRDIRILEIIEGTSQIHEIIISNNELSKRRR